MSFGDSSDEEGNEVVKRYETTPGRVRLGALLPMNAKAPFDLVNRLLRKGDVQTVIDTVYRYCGQKESVIFCDQIMSTGFREAFKAGISFGKDDMLIPDTKWGIVNGVREQVKEVSFASVRSELSRLTDSYRDVQPGDRYALRWSGEQLTLSLNGTPLFQSPNLELAIAMFAIWLGSDPLDDGFRDALLGR